MPTNVSRFERLAYLSIVLGLISAVATTIVLATLNPSIAGLAITFTLGVSSILLILQAVLVWLAARHRKNWARIVLLIWFVISLLSTLYHLPGLLHAGLYFGSLYCCATLAMTFALYFVFSGNSHEWFESSAQPNS
jgi:hypothetical protein